MFLIVIDDDDRNTLNYGISAVLVSRQLRAQRSMTCLEQTHAQKNAAPKGQHMDVICNLGDLARLMEIATSLSLLAMTGARLVVLLKRPTHLRLCERSESISGISSV